MSSLNNVRLPSGEELNIAEWLHWPLYSSLDFGAADPINLNAFSYTKGNPVPRTATPAARTSTLADTNLVRKAKMNQDEALVVFSLTYEIFSSASAQEGSPPVGAAQVPLFTTLNLRRLQAETIVKLVVGAGIKKPQWDAPFSYLSQGVGTTYTTTSGLGTDLGTGGYTTPQNQRMLNLPIYIGGTGENAAPGNSRRFVLTWESCFGAVGSQTGYQALDQGGTVRFWLDGLKKRPG